MTYEFYMDRRSASACVASVCVQCACVKVLRMTQGTLDSVSVVSDGSVFVSSFMFPESSIPLLVVLI